MIPSELIASLLLAFAKVVVFCLSAWLVLFVLFLAVMALREARDAGRLVPGTPAYRLGKVVLFGGYLVDAFVNLGPATLLFLECPIELTVTARCKRLVKQGGYRGDVARWLCENLLHPIDPGHCN